MPAMGGSRATTADRERVAKTILNPDAVVTEVERRRCLDSVEAYNNLIDIWHATEPCPSLAVACIAGHPWLEVFCHGCNTVKSVDLAGLNIHPQARITAIAFRMRCTVCGRKGPRIQGLRCEPPESLQDEQSRKWIEANGYPCAWDGMTAKLPK